MKLRENSDFPAADPCGVSRLVTEDLNGADRLAVNRNGLACL